MLSTPSNPTNTRNRRSRIAVNPDGPFADGTPATGGMPNRTSPAVMT